ncbi:AfsR/SARP family transcriptional regulator [Lentzea sp. NPDC042327]|uniref:AfsR/SARP family transcriptional regulator n=1 Tax=Lentzea sp. NPDC042327 TaxID=3154801 RepID=UPI0033F600EC
MKISILGPLELSEDGVKFRVPGEKLRALVAALALCAGRPATKEQLIDELWPDSPPRNAANSLQGHVARLRKILGEETGRESLRDIVQTSDAGYALALAPQDIDGLKFCEMVNQVGLRPDMDSLNVIAVLTEALSLWRGPALIDTGHGRISRLAYARLAETKLNAYERLFDAQLALGENRALITELEQLHQQHPLRERFCGQLMTALYQAGRQAEALDLYHQLRQRLAVDLGLEPSQALRDKFHGILQQDPALLR